MEQGLILYQPPMIYSSMQFLQIRDQTYTAPITVQFMLTLTSLRQASTWWCLKEVRTTWEKFRISKLSRPLLLQPSSRRRTISQHHLPQSWKLLPSRVRKTLQVQRENRSLVEKVPIRCKSRSPPSSTLPLIPSIPQRKCRTQQRYHLRLCQVCKLGRRIQGHIQSRNASR